MPLLALLALFIVVPLAELYVILKVGDAIGALWTILLLAADSVLGSLLLRAQGRVGLAPLQRDAGGRARAASRGDRRRARRSSAARS